MLANNGKDKDMLPWQKDTGNLSRVTARMYSYVNG